MDKENIAHCSAQIRESILCITCTISALCYFCLGPAATGDETATEGEAHIRAFVFAPGTERHHNDSAVVFRSILKSLRETEKNQLTYNESYACLNLLHSQQRQE